jgi:hypothetical protein
MGRANLKSILKQIRHQHTKKNKNNWNSDIDESGGKNTKLAKECDECSQL